MMLFRTCLWLMIVSNDLSCNAYLLMDSEQNYIPTDKLEGENQRNVDELGEVCPVLYPRYPYIFGHKPQAQGFRFKCKRLTPKQVSDEDVDALPTHADILKNSQKRMTGEETSDSQNAKINNNKPLEARDIKIPHIINNINNTIANEIKVPNAETNLKQDQTNIHEKEDISKEIKTEDEPYIVKAVPTDCIVEAIPTG